MKILFLPSWYPQRYNFTDGIFVRRHAECVAQHTTNDVAVLHVYNRQDEGKPDFEIIDNTINGVRTIVVYYHAVKNNFPILSQILRYRKWKRAYELGWNHLTKTFGQPDAAHVQVAWRAGMFALQLLRRFQIPYLVTEHWSGYDKQVGTFKGFAMKNGVARIVRHAEIVAPINQRIIHLMQAHGLQNEYTVVPNVVDTDFFKPASHQNKICRIVHISNFKSEKNTPGILRAAKLLLEKRKDFELILAGGNTYFDETKKVFDELKLDEENVKLVRKLSPDEVVKQLQQSDAFLLFSHYEGMPCTIIEAWACGLPVISSNVGGISEWLDNSNGILVEPGNETALANAISSMIDSYQSFEKDKIRKFAVETFSAPVVAQQFDTLYKHYFNQ